jgi:hypothetical protein
MINDSTHVLTYGFPYRSKYHWSYFCFALLLLAATKILYFNINRRWYNYGGLPSNHISNARELRQLIFIRSYEHSSSTLSRGCRTCQYIRTMGMYLGRSVFDETMYAFATAYAWVTAYVFGSLMNIWMPWLKVGSIFVQIILKSKMLCPDNTRRLPAIWRICGGGFLCTSEHEVTLNPHNQGAKVQRLSTKLSMVRVINPPMRLCVNSRWAAGTWW